MLATANILSCGAVVSASVTITGNIDEAGGTVPNVWSTVTSWSPESFNRPAPVQFNKMYPFITHIELFTATGGCYAGFPGCKDTRDLLSDPARGLAGGVNISNILGPLRNIVAAGLIPHVVTGNVPIALSASPRLGGFGFNNEPPRNLSEYREYIARVVTALASEFGRTEVARWRWGVFTEYNNHDWLNSSAERYFDIFDHTVCGLEDALGGPANVDVGAHACVQCGTKAWDPLLLLHHVAAGTSKCSGRRPHLNFTANSFYEHGPGDPGDLSMFETQGLAVLNMAKQLGLDTSRFGIDEGRLLWGPEGPSAPLTTRAVGTGYQASWDALFLKKLVHSGSRGAYYSRWGVSANYQELPGSLFADPELTVTNVAANVAKLGYKLAGGRLITVNSTSAPSRLSAAALRVCSGCVPSAYKPNLCQCGCSGCKKDACCCPGGLPHPCIPCIEPTQSSIVDATVTIHGQGGDVLRALVFHHHPSFTAYEEGVQPIATELILCGLSEGSTDTASLRGTVTYAGRTNGNFWPAWWRDQRAANLSRANGDYTTWSIYSDSPPLASDKARNVFAAGLKNYQAAAMLKSQDIDAVVVDGCVRVKLDMQVHEVALVELHL